MSAQEMAMQVISDHYFSLLDIGRVRKYLAHVQPVIAGTSDGHRAGADEESKLR